MPTGKKYWESTYLLEHRSKVTKIGKDDKGSWIRVTDTVFHPQGGGQPSDIGTINGVAVSKATYAADDKDEINHYVANTNDFKEGVEVVLSVNKDKRLQHAALHTCGHLIEAIIRKDYKITDTQTAAHHFPGECRVAFKIGASQKAPQPADLEQKVNDSIKAAKAVIATAGDKRQIQIEGFGANPCGGTHLPNIREIANFKVKKIESKKGELKISYDAEYAPKAEAVDSKTASTSGTSAAALAQSMSSLSMNAANGSAASSTAAQSSSNTAVVFK